MKKIYVKHGYEIWVDNEDYKYLSSVNWYVKNNGDGNLYAIRQIQENGIRKEIAMHRLLLGITDRNIHVDHKDGNSLNNQKHNLRICTNAQNRLNSKKYTRKNNTSIYKGVRKDVTRKLVKPWQAYISIEGKRIILGRFKTEIEAARAYNKAAVKYHKEFARVNNILSDHEEGKE